MAVIDNYGPNEQAIIELFSAVFNKAPTPDLIAAGADALASGASQADLLNLLFNAPQVPVTAYKATAPTNSFVSTLVDNLTAGSSISAATKDQWIGILSSEVNNFGSRGEFAATLLQLVQGGDWAGNADLAALQANLAAKAEIAAKTSYNSTDVFTGYGALKNVDGSAAANLTFGHDDLSGSNDYYAPVVQNPTLGSVTNTLETGDIIRGIDGGTLTADLVLSSQAGIPIGPAISSTTNNIDKIILRAQTGQLDIAGAPHGNLSHIDAERNYGVKEWWSQDSRASIQVEDVRTLPEDTLIGVRNTDPEVDFLVYFDPAQLINRVSSESSLTISLFDITNPTSLENVPIDGVAFVVDGVTIALRSDAMGAAKTHAEFFAALQAALAATPAAAGITATLNADNSITFNDPNGGVFAKGGWSFIDNVVPADGNIKYNQEVGDPTLSTEPVTTSVVLDAVGRTSQGGVVDIGSLGDGGIERFNVEVQRDSWVAALRSTEHLGNLNGNNNLPFNHLEIVNFTSAGANGNVKVGTVDEGNLPGKLDGRLFDGLVDVRVVDGSAFKGQLNLGITLTPDSVDRFLDGAEEPVQFSYTGSAQNDLFNIVATPDTLNDVDFRGNVDLGAGDDRLVLNANGGWLKNLSVNGGEGNNTIVVSNTNVGTTANFTFASFQNFQNYEIEGNGATTHNFANLPGVTNFVVATGDTDTTLLNLPATLNTVTISGKNQTVDQYGNRNNADQNFGTIAIRAAAAAELTVKLDNTARVDGELTVDVLNVEDNGATQSAVRTLNIESNGTRDTANEIGEINAERVSTFNLTGTQDLSVYLNQAANTQGNVNGYTDLVVNGADAAGDLTVGVNAAIVNALHGQDKTSTFTAGEGTADLLIFDGATAVTKALVTASGFETVRFNDGGDYNAVNTTGVTLYDSRNGDALQIINLRGEENVKVGVKTGTSTAPNSNAVSNAGGDQGFVTNAVSAGSKINVDITGAAANQLIKTDGYTTLSLHLSEDKTLLDAHKAYTLDLGTQAFDSVAGVWVAGTDATNVATPPAAPANHISNIELRNVVLTGGTGELNGAGDTSISSADLGQLLSPVQLLDVSGYKGSVVAQLSAREIATVTPGANPAVTYDTGNTVVKVGAYGIDVTVDHNAYDNGAASATIGKVVTFEFTADTLVNASGDPASTDFDWTINGFKGVNMAAGVNGAAAGGAGNVTVLDLAALGARTLADLKFTDVGGDLHITDNTGADNYEIVLVGVVQAQLGLENFKFAV